MEKTQVNHGFPKMVSKAWIQNWASIFQHHHEPTFSSASPHLEPEGNL